MTDPRDTAAAFNKVGVHLEPLLVRLGRASPGAELEIVRDEITAALDAVGLRWVDVAARIAAQSPAKPQPASYMPPPPEFYVTPERRPLADVEPTRPIDGATVMSNQELSAYGYRQRGPGYGYEGTEVPGVGTVQGDGPVRSGES